jgi:hypothetical protein
LVLALPIVAELELAPAAGATVAGAAELIVGEGVAGVEVAEPPVEAPAAAPLAALPAATAARAFAGAERIALPVVFVLGAGAGLAAGARLAVAESVDELGLSATIHSPKKATTATSAI